MCFFSWLVIIRNGQSQTLKREKKQRLVLGYSFFPFYAENFHFTLLATQSPKILKAGQKMVEQCFLNFWCQLFFFFTVKCLLNQLISLVVALYTVYSCVWRIFFSWWIFLAPKSYHFFSAYSWFPFILNTYDADRIKFSWMFLFFDWRKKQGSLLIFFWWFSSNLGAHNCIIGRWNCMKMLAVQHVRLPDSSDSWALPMYTHWTSYTRVFIFLFLEGLLIYLREVYWRA